MLATAIVLSIGCAALLEDDWFSETPNLMTPPQRHPEEQIEASNFDELMDAMIDLIMAHETSGRIIVNSYEGEDIQADVDRAGNEIITHHPIGIYAVSEIVGQVTRIVAYFEIDISIEYKRSPQEVDSIINVSDILQLRIELYNIMSEYHEEAVFRTMMQTTDEEVLRLIAETYYQNPRSIVMLPIAAVEIFPESGSDRIFVLSFGFRLNDTPAILRNRSNALSDSVRRRIELAVSDDFTDAEALLSLAENLIAFADFDVNTANLISEHGAQRWAATASGALLDENAIGEGFAMAFKALCDELGLECIVVLGFLGGRYHAWNIISIDGEYYHIDVAMGDVNGIDTSFLRTDAQFIERGYEWEFENTPSANGTLTYEDVVRIDEPDEPEDPDDEDSAGEAHDDSGSSTPEAPNEPETEPDEESEEPDEEDDEEEPAG